VQLFEISVPVSLTSLPFMETVI